MRSVPLLLLAAWAVSCPASAETARPGWEIAREAATAAVVACEHLGFRTMATVVDGSGQVVAAMVADPQLAETLAYDSVHTAQIAAYFHDRSSNIPERLQWEPPVAYAIHDHPQLSPFEPGGVPFPGPETMAAIGVTGRPNSDNLSGLGVAGAAGGDRDEECARDGVMDVLQALK
jgi:uncharacterized protein GlcG (DUF336 family)